MESDNNAGDVSTATPTWNSATNWTAVHGTLANSITFESSLAPIDADEETMDPNSVADWPLILRPDAPDSGPCEITIFFPQKHEVQQIYVKSTARVYEVYYELDRQSGKEYLCTVRCSIAAGDTNNGEDISTSSKGVHDTPSQEKRNGGNRTTSEDEWVDVKVPDASALGKKDISLPLITQDYYEATAQISDAHPCRSITIRLLSVQSKDSVYVDEVYVFADPVDSTDSDNQANQMEKSSGNSLMSMLLPTLLQMSKAKGVNATKTQDKHTSEASRTQNLQENASEATCPMNVATKFGQEENSSIALNTDGISADQLQRPPQISCGESKTDSLPPNDRIERALDQLFSRMGRIEDLFLRFEDNLQKPISSIDARLQRVEQQLETLTNKQKDSEPRLYSRFCAPNFSSVQSDSNSFFHSESDYPRCEEFGSNIRSIHSDAQTNQADDVSDSLNATRLLPSLVVTAPEFLNCDDEEENQESDRISESSADKPRKALTVDDALASALAGFVFSISSQPEKHIPSLSVKAPEFSNEEDTEVDKEASSRGQHEMENITSSRFSNAPCPSLDGESKMERSLNDDQLEEAAEDVGGQYWHFEGGEDDQPSGGPFYKNDEQAEDDKAGTRNIERAKVIEGGEVSPESSCGLVHNKNDVQYELCLNHSDATVSLTTMEDARSGTDLITAAENTKAGSENKDRDILRDILEFPHAAASVVDFESPVLDVKFIPQNSCNLNITLEALLSDLPESKVDGATCVDESHITTPCDEHGNLILVEDGEEPVGLVTNGQIYVDFDYCNLQQEALSGESETPMASTSTSSCSHETFPTSLI